MMPIFTMSQSSYEEGKIKVVLSCVENMKLREDEDVSGSQSK